MTKKNLSADEKLQQMLEKARKTADKVQKDLQLAKKEIDRKLETGRALQARLDELENTKNDLVQSLSVKDELDYIQYMLGVNVLSEEDVKLHEQVLDEIKSIQDQIKDSDEFQMLKKHEEFIAKQNEAVRSDLEAKANKINSDSRAKSLALLKREIEKINARFEQAKNGELLMKSKLFPNGVSLFEDLYLALNTASSKYKAEPQGSAKSEAELKAIENQLIRWGLYPTVFIEVVETQARIVTGDDGKLSLVKEQRSASLSGKTAVNPQELANRLRAFRTKVYPKRLAGKEFQEAFGVKISENPKYIGAAPEAQNVKKVESKPEQPKAVKAKTQPKKEGKTWSFPSSSESADDELESTIANAFKEALDKIQKEDGSKPSSNSK